MNNQSCSVDAEHPATLPQHTLDNESLFEILDEFLDILGRRDREPVHIRALSPKQSAKKISKKLTITRRQLRDDPQVLAHLLELNKTLGLYFVVNKGGNKAADITTISAFFGESDSGTIQEQHERLDALPLRPSIRIETKKSVHAYWLVNGPCTLEEWREIQPRIAAAIDGDPSIKDLSRCMRLPGFDHLALSESGEIVRTPVVLERVEGGKRYTADAIEVSL